MKAFSRSWETFRLSLLTFFLLFALGAVSPILSLYLTRYLHFTGGQAGIILSLSALSAVVAPLIGSFVADRLVSSERLLSICLFGTSITTFLLSRVHGFGAVMAAYFGYVLLLGPVSALNNSVIFHHVPDRKRDYGGIRVFGTMGWIAVAWLFSFLWLRDVKGIVIPERLPDALLLSSLTYLLLGVYSLTLPVRLRLDPGRRPGLLPADSLAVIVKPQVVLLTAVSLVCFIVDRFYYYGAAIFLKQSGFDTALIMPVMSVGQVVEIPAMALLGVFIARLGMKKVLLLGMLGNLVRYLLFIISDGGPAMTVAGIAFHGLNFAFFFSAASIFIDSHVVPASRAGAHQLYALLTTGLGGLIGSLTAGYCSEKLVQAQGGGTDFRIYWGICLGILVAGFVAMSVWFKDEGPSAAGRKIIS